MKGVVGLLLCVAGLVFLVIGLFVWIFGTDGITQGIIGVILLVIGVKLLASSGAPEEKDKESKTPEVEPVIKTMYTERYIPDDSDEATKIRERQKKAMDETTDQRLKRLAKETQHRMEAIGLSMYVWSTCNDERVCKSCEKMDEKLCRWDDSTVYSRTKGKTWIPRPKGASLTHPGEKDGCRCTSFAFWDEMVN